MMLDTFIVSLITSLIVSLIIMKFHMRMVQKWLADFFDKQDLWLKDHFADLAKKLFR